MLVMGEIVEFSVRLPEQKDIKLELDDLRFNELIESKYDLTYQNFHGRLNLNVSIGM